MEGNRTVKNDVLCDILYDILYDIRLYIFFVGMKHYFNGVILYSWEYGRLQESFFSVNIITIRNLQFFFVVFLFVLCSFFLFFSCFFYLYFILFCFPDNLF